MRIHNGNIISFKSKIPLKNGFKIICDTCERSVKDVPQAREQKYLAHWLHKFGKDFCSKKCECDYFIKKAKV